jgi:cytochrome P450
MEGGVDQMVKLFVTKVRGFAGIGNEKAGVAFDFAVWAQYFTFDTVLMLMQSRAHGFMEHGSDHMGYISNVLKGLTLFNYINHFPWLIYALRTKTLQRFAPKETDSAGLGHLMGIGRQAVRQRLAEMDQGGQKKHDILQGLIDAKSESAEKDQASEDEILAEAMIPIVAGSDSTATAIRAIVLELARHAPVLTKLRQELHEAWRKGSISEPVQLAETSNLRYLDAVIRESMRTRPSTSVIFRREVPISTEGLLIHDAGAFYDSPIKIPPGTEVGMNPYVVAKSKDLYGRDAHLFRPERWLPATTSEVDRVKRMERLDFTFLFGPRTCLGKGIAAMEIRKSIVEVRDFLMIALRLGGTLTVRLAGPEFRLRTFESSRPPLGCEGTWRILHPQEYVGEGFRKK